MYKRILTFITAGLVVLSSCEECPQLQVKVRKLDGTNLSEISHVSMGYSIGDTIALWDNNDRKHYTIVAIIDTLN